MHSAVVSLAIGLVISFVVRDQIGRQQDIAERIIACRYELNRDDQEAKMEVFGEANTLWVYYVFEYTVSGPWQEQGTCSSEKKLHGIQLFPEFFLEYAYSFWQIGC